MAYSAFQFGSQVFCSECPAQRNRKGEQIGVKLECSDRNYSGTGVDIGNCPQCGKGFSIIYKLDHVKRNDAWDVDIEQEKRECERLKQEEISRTEARLAELKGKAKP